VAQVPHGAEAARDADGKPLSYVRLQFVFAEDRLAERQLMRMPEAKVLVREVIGADGSVRLLDADGKEHSLRKGTLAVAKAPDLKTGPYGSSGVAVAVSFRRARAKDAAAGQTENRRVAVR